MRLGALVAAAALAGVTTLSTGCALFGGGQELRNEPWLRPAVVKVLRTDPDAPMIDTGGPPIAYSCADPANPAVRHWVMDAREGWPLDFDAKSCLVLAPVPEQAMDATEAAAKHGPEFPTPIVRSIRSVDASE